MGIENIRNDNSHSIGISRRKFFTIASSAAAGLLIGKTAAFGTNTPLALINGALIDGTEADAISDGAVVITRGRIVASGPRKRIKIPSNSKIIDIQGGTILPGFINSHVHAAYSISKLQAWAQEGVTTVRDLGHLGPYTPELFKLRSKLCADPKCARLLAVGSFINVEGGYPKAFWGGYPVTVNSPVEARQAANRLIDDGADVIKTAFESGYSFGQTGWPLLSPEQATALVKAAHQRGKPVTAHVTSVRDLEIALDAGVDEIAHMVVDMLSEKLITRMVKDGIRWVPTLELWHGVSRIHYVDYDYWAIKNLSGFIEAGGEVALGTDYAGAPRVDFDLGMPITEIELMQKAGMTPMQIIVSATKNGARSCNIDSDLGTLEPGKIADVLVIDGNPLKDLTNLTKTKLVIKDGNIIKS